MISRFLSILLSALLCVTPMALAQSAPPTPLPPSVLAGTVPLSVSNSSSRVALPASIIPFNAITVFNAGTKTAYFAQGGSSVVATTSSTPLDPGQTLTIWVSGTYVAAITGGSDTTTLRVYQANGPLWAQKDTSSSATSAPCSAFGTTAGTCAQGNDSRIVGALQASLNLSDLASAATARTNLGLGTAAIANTGTSGHTLPFLDGANTYSTLQQFTAMPVVNLNTAPAPASITGSGLLISPADGVTGRMQVNGYGTIAAVTTARYDGTLASPTAVQANDQLGGFNGYAYDGTNLDGPIASFRCYATDVITSAHWGSKCAIATSTTNTNTLTDKFVLDQAGNATLTGTLNNLTLPVATDTFALLAATQTLSNKTLIGTNSNGYELVGSTCVTGACVIMNRSNLTTGWGSSATNTITGFISGTDTFDWASTGSKNHANGSASNAATLWDGTINTICTGTTCFPNLFIQPSGAAAVTAFNVAGTAFGVNLPSGSTADFLSFHLNGNTGYSWSSGGRITTSALSLNAASLSMFGGRGGASIGTAGAQFQSQAHTTTDTASSGTIAEQDDSVFAVPTFVASNATTLTNASTLRIFDPVCSTNVTCTNKWSLLADSASIGGTRITSAGAILGASDIQAAGASSFAFSSRARIFSPSNGVVNFTFNDGTTAAALTAAAITLSGLTTNAGGQFVCATAGGLLYKTATTC